MLKKKTNFCLSQHISSIDLLHKYLFKNKIAIPRIEKIVLVAKLNKMILNTGVFGSEEVYFNSAFFLLYSYCLMSPNIILLKKNVDTHVKNDFILKLILKNRKDIITFLDYMHIYLQEKDVNFLKYKTSISDTTVDIVFPLFDNLSLRHSIESTFSFNFNLREVKKKNFFFKCVPFWLLKSNG